jgi:chaperonin GroEL
MNTVRGTLKIVAVKAPFYGERRTNILADLALSTGAELISRESGVRLQDLKVEHFGQCRSVDITKTNTTIIGGKGDFGDIDKRIELLKTDLQTTEELAECNKIQERITKLAAGVAVIHVGAPTEVEMTEKKHRIEDALEAVRSAKEEGVVAGGGVALLRSAANLSGLDVENEDQQFGVDIMRRAVAAPIRQMAINCGLSPDLIINSVEHQMETIGYDFRKDEIVDMIENGIIDPVKVTRTALQNAASAAGILLTTSHAIVEI